jgi:uncharacterized membrane protein
VAGARTALFALLVFALSPLHIWYSQDGRMYAELVFFSLLGTILFLEAVDTQRAGWWVLYAFTLAAGLLLQVFMVFTALSHLLWLILCRRRALPAFRVAVAGTALPFLPWLGWFVHSFSVSFGAWERSGFLLGALPYAFFAYAVGFSLGPSVAELHDDHSLRFLLQFWPTILAVAALWGALLAVGLYGLVRRDLERAVFCLLGLFVPLAGVMLYSLGLRFNVRYTMVAFPFFCVCIGQALAFLSGRSRLLLGIFLAGLLAVTAWSLSNYYTNPRYAKADVCSAVERWRRAADGAPLFSNVHYSVERYLEEAEKGRHFPIPGGFASPAAGIKTLLRTLNRSDGYVLLARDSARLHGDRGMDLSRGEGAAGNIQSSRCA